MNVGSLPGCPNGLPTVVAIRNDGSEVLIGDEANEANETSFLKLRNWKMLLGKSDSELQSQLARNSELSRLLSKTTLASIAKQYFATMLSKSLENEADLSAKPQVILGIPPTTTENQIKWRQNYKKLIEGIFVDLEYPKPKFWPEPFAVFQYHLNGFATC